MLSSRSICSPKYKPQMQFVMMTLKTVTRNRWKKFNNSLFNLIYAKYLECFLDLLTLRLFLRWDPSIINIHPNSFFSFDPLNALELWVPLAEHACVIGSGLLSTARERVKPFHLTYPAHGSVSTCPLPWCWHRDRNDSDGLVYCNYFSLVTKVHMK
jgi:hypothetical protein